MNLKGKILWVDDEIDLLKPHIIYLENKGYNVVPVHSGEDAIHLTQENSFDLVLLDEMMTGLDGLTTLKYIKEIHPNLPIIMITKNEEESLMEEAIASHITNYLTKPVNPSQILIACKNVLETKKIQSDSAAQRYLKDFENIANKISCAKKLEDWYEINHRLTDWKRNRNRFRQTPHRLSPPALICPGLVQNAKEPPLPSTVEVRGFHTSRRTRS